MALLMWVPLSIPHFHSPSFITSHKHKPLLLRSTIITTLPKASLNINNQNHSNDVALLWFKHDLRLDDHPALVSSAASQYHTILPLYIFDHRIISRFSDETLELVLLALKDLKTCLQDRGSNLMIRYGDAESIISKIVSEVVVSCHKLGLKQIKSIDVFAEEEVEYNLRQMIGSVDECLANLSLSRGSSTQLVSWQTPFYDIENLKKFPAFYSDFKKLNLTPTSPLATPVLPHLDITLDWGTIPTYDELRKYSTSVNSYESNEMWQSVKRISAKSVLSKGRVNQIKMPNDFSEGSSKSRSVNLENSVFLSREGTVVGGGTSAVLNALAAYLRDLEGTSRGDWQEVHEKLRKAESRSGASFGALFRSALSLGILSRRRVYYEAIKYEKERNAGFLSPFGYSAATVAAAVDTVCIMEWYHLLASKSHTNSGRTNSDHIWRWNEYLIRYTALGQEGPAVLLVHGFGAFLEHYRDNMTPVADGGNRVWAITLLGFGKSEKPNVVYTELMWAEMLRDFIIDVVGEPVHLVGNSIGGYFAAIVAGLWPSLARSIVLINTAGSVIPGNPSVLGNE
ncbi:Hydrolase protein, partial [Thalictrum thalictroides]